MDRPIVSIAALVVSFAALAASLSLRFLDSGTGSGAATTAADPGMDQRLRRIEEEQSSLRQQFEAVRASSGLGALREAEPVAEAGPGPAAVPAAEPEVVARLDALERALAPVLREVAEDAERDALRSASVFELEVTARDPTATERDRLRALSRLRGRKLEDGSDARTRGVILSMIDLYRSSDSASTRANIFRQLDGVEDPILKQPLLDALARDVDDVREEAAETLAHYQSDPAVRAALERARDSDPSEEVRDQARESLEGRHPDDR